MNVFVLNSGRCGSTTFIAACRHINNFSSAHESCCKLLGSERLAYPPRHIEADNRLCWFLGALDERYGDNACYVHLSREREATAASFARRRDFGIMQAFREGILMGGPPEATDLELAKAYLDMIDANIHHFLKDKSRCISVRLESAAEDFRQFWHWIEAEGDLDAALAEWQVRHNASSL